MNEAEAVDDIIKVMVEVLLNVAAREAEAGRDHVAKLLRATADRLDAKAGSGPSQGSAEAAG